MANLRPVTPYGTVPDIQAGDIIHAADWNTIQAALKSAHERGVRIGSASGYKDNQYGHYHPWVGFPPYNQLLAGPDVQAVVKMQKPPGYDNYTLQIEYMNPAGLVFGPIGETTIPCYFKMEVGLSVGTGNYLKIFETSSTPAAITNPFTVYFGGKIPNRLSGNMGVASAICIYARFGVVGTDYQPLNPANGNGIRLPDIDPQYVPSYYAGIGRVSLSVYKSTKTC